MSLSVGAGADVDPEPEDDPGQGQQPALVKARLTQTQSTPSLSLRPGRLSLCLDRSQSLSRLPAANIAVPGPSTDQPPDPRLLLRTFEELWSDLATRVTLCGPVTAHYAQILGVTFK